MLDGRVNVCALSQQIAFAGVGQQPHSSPTMIAASVKPFCMAEAPIVPEHSVSQNHKYINVY